MVKFGTYAVGAAITLASWGGAVAASCLNEEDMRRGVIVTFENESSVGDRI